MIRRPPRSTQGVSSAASDVYKRQGLHTRKDTIDLFKYVIDLLDVDKIDGIQYILLNMIWSENTDERLRNREVNEAQIYISLRDLFSKHEEVQKSLKGGKWNERDQGPITESNPGEELAKVDSYLRFYEYCYVLIDNRIINPKTFKEMYGPYIDDIKRNYQIMQIIDEEGWPLFNNLLKRLDKINDLESTKPDSEKKLLHKLIDKIRHY